MAPWKGYRVVEGGSVDRGGFERLRGEPRFQGILAEMKRVKK